MTLLLVLLSIGGSVEIVDAQSKCYGALELGRGPHRMIRFAVRGRIAPKGSRTVRPLPNGKVVTRPASKHEKRWVDAVAQTALVYRAEGAMLTDPPYAVELVFHFKRPAKPSYGWPVRVDQDKAVRATYDGLVLGGVIVDDKHIVRTVASSVWAEGEEHCVVTITQAG